MNFDGLTMNQLAERNAMLVQELEKAREVTNCPADVSLQEHLKQLVAENAVLNSFIKTSCYVYDGDGSDVSDSYTPAHESPMLPKQPRYILPVVAECKALRDAFISYLVSENMSNKPDADEQKVHAHCAKWVDSMCKTPATDNILRETQARGVEKFTDRLQQFLDDGDFVGDEIPVIAGAIYCGKELSEQLREGKA